MRALDRSCSGSKDGIALVMVLAFIVLLTILVVSFIAFTRLNRISTASYSKSIQAQEIAQGGLQDILGDLHNEIIAGSKVYNTNSSGTAYVNSYAAAYVPATNLTAAPARIGFAPASYGTDATPALLSPTLVRVSRATGNPNAVGGDTFFTQLAASPATGNYTNGIASVPGTTILNRASMASTTNAYNGGRYISASRWNKSYLLATNSSTVPSAFTNAAPDWVYVTRTGSRVCTTIEVKAGSLNPSPSLAASYGTVTAGFNPPVSPVVGRYAFIMYDEGALLDANVAGYTHLSTNLSSVPIVNNPAGVSEAVYGKSYAAYADLTQLPGFNTSGGQTYVDNFVYWRNASYSPSSNTTNYLNAVFNYAQNGFLSFQSGDSPLLSRQDLINYFGNLDKAGGTTYSSALPYLGTFTRAVTWPSWRPVFDSSSILPGTGAGYSPPAAGTAPVLYKTNAEKSTAINPDFANVRFPAAATVNHYNDSSTTASTYPVSAGDPLLEHRFSLAKINWLTHSGPATGMAQAVQDCFGLEWSNANAATGKPSWVYDIHKSGSSPNLSIMTLSQVAAAGREPDFFELLKAAILSGSLGRDPGAIGTSTGPPSYTYINGPGGVSFNITAKVTDMQVMQIGANIIDQWDADSYPTAIYFAGSGYADAPTVPEFGTGNMVYGIENLPYLNRVFIMGWDTTPSAPAGGTYDAWFQPEFWDPFQVPAVTTGRPTSFCVRAYGTLNTTWDSSWGNIPQPSSDPAPPTGTFKGSCAMNWDTYATGSNDACVVFSDSSIPSTFVNPQILTAANAGNYTIAKGAPLFSTASINIAPVPPLTSTQGAGDGPSTYAISKQFLGIHAASTPYSWSSVATSVGGTVAYDYAGGWQTQMRTHFAPANQGITFCLMYYDGSQYLPYTYLSRYAAGSPQTATAAGANPVGIGMSDPPSNTTVGAAATTSDPIWGFFGPGSPVAHTDPLTDRFSVNFNDGSHGPGGGGTGGPWYDRIVGTNHTWQDLNKAPFPCAGYGAEYGVPCQTSGFVYWQQGAQAWAEPYWAIGLWVGNWAQNNQTVSTGGGVNQDYAYYADPDGVVRPGNDYRWLSGYANGDGMSQLTSGYSTTTGSGTKPTTTVSRRPLVLNRPFRSVAEMGYAHRDLPFKSLDFFSPYSADAALLDVFSLTDEPTVVAGQVNPSNSPTPVISALISGSNKQELTSSDIIGSEAPTVAAAIATQLSPSSGSGPVLSRADLVTRLSNPIQAAFTVSADQSDKNRLEAPVRALAGVTNTRTWNLMIDVIAQSGHMSPTAATLNDFVVEGEKRYWLHIAIDRYTGKIVDQQLEPVYE